MKTLLTCSFLILFYGCSIKTLSLKGRYPETPIVYKTDNSFDKVWDRLVDLFAQQGLTIKIIDKSSGLMISSNSVMPATVENKNGEMLDPTAYIVIPRIKNGNLVYPVSGWKNINKRNLGPHDVYGEWNVRIKPDGAGATINVNITNVSFIENSSSRPTSLYDYKSTGVFEKTIFELVR
jgi:hypothetical protein